MSGQFNGLLASDSTFSRASCSPHTERRKDTIEGSQRQNVCVCVGEVTAMRMHRTPSHGRCDKQTIEASVSCLCLPISEGLLPSQAPTPACKTQTVAHSTPMQWGSSPLLPLSHLLNRPLQIHLCRAPLHALGTPLPGGQSLSVPYSRPGCKTVPQILARSHRDPLPPSSSVLRVPGAPTEDGYPHIRALVFGPL